MRHNNFSEQLSLKVIIISGLILAAGTGLCESTVEIQRDIQNNLAAVEGLQSKYKSSQVNTNKKVSDIQQQIEQAKSILLSVPSDSNKFLDTKTRLTEHVYEYDADRDSNVIEVYVNRLRKYLGKDRISTLRGQGYRFEADPE